MAKQSDKKRATLAGTLSRWLIATTLVALLVGYACYLQVPEGRAAVVTRFGQPVRELVEPGPYFKLPWPVEDARLIDMRKRVFNTPYTATLTRDRRNVVLLTYVVWRVAEPELFLQSVGDEKAAAAKLDGMVTAAKNTLMGRYDLSALVSTDPSNIKTSEIEAGIESDVQSVAAEKFGIAVEQVGFKRIAYEDANVTAVLAQMRAEREAEAKQLRAFGDKEARRIRDDAAVTSEEILRDGRLTAGKIRGEAERKAAEIYAKAHQTDPDFYRYWRSLEALKRTLSRDATVVLRTDQGFFDLLTDPPEAPRPVPTPSGGRTLANERDGRLNGGGDE
ncbi:protease modulator HflC [Stratiformator vulcanicus]|uniref:Protein HflC n=1 Tax=Stratiformator vulcanicus TaxID=2527980 RepID=A0A517QYI9_9PLAN|nr:protease modulator HflC [Stratiformator vulcanicus]QDT36658.1 Modulator of FtsH protease HflC [Stratiformator vulcanicus]